MTEDFVRRVSGVAALADPVRRALYEHVSHQGEPISREQAATLAGVPVHTARFHLDRLVESGLLEVEYRRLSGRSGPGAGRPAKLYRRAAQEVAVSVPPRRYDLAGLLLADAVAESARSGVPATDALGDVARRRGRAMVRPGAPETRVPTGTLPEAVEPADDVVGRACAVLAEHGYAPRVVGGAIHLANCPFHALVRDHPELVCGMNLALLDGLADGLGDGLGAATDGHSSLRARLDPAEGRCCVVLEPSAFTESSPAAM